ncbi:MAG TPA: molybdopterin-dependent oxidoreductase [Deltaproteobacteria bacterium]|nr:molybdopterin-dependent oxidoreductase [Deltaproteobacteria bacterium]
MVQKLEKTVPVSCNKDCGGGCALLAQVQNGKIVKITDNPLIDEHMKGCIRGYHVPDTVHSELRLKRPLLNTGSRGSGEFKEIAWEEAFSRISEKLGEIRETHGCESVLAFNGSGSCRGAFHHTNLQTQRFFSLFGGFTGRNDSYSNAAAGYVEKFLFGTRMVGLDPPTLEHSRLIILWGANPSSVRFSSRIESWLHKRKDDGIPVVVIDPRRSRTVRKLATQWIPIQPGTDTAMMAAVLHVLLEEGYADLEFAEKYTIGFDDLSSYILGRTDGIPKDPEWAEGICGVPAETITHLARTYGTEKPAALLPGFSIQRILGGEETYRFATALQAATGNIGRVGGSSGGEFKGMLPIPYFPQLPVPETSAFVRLPVYTWPDAVLEGKDGGYPTDIRAIYNVGTNYLNQGSDIKKNIRAFNSVEWVVTQDYFMTPTARYSDIVLPVTTCFEREDVVFPADNYLFYSGKAIDPLYETKNDYEIFCELSERLGFGSDFSENRTSEQWLEKFMAESDIEDTDRFKTTGIFKGNDHHRTGLSDFIAKPQENPLDTPSGKIEIRSQAYAKTGFSPIPECRITAPPKDHPFRMITPHARFRVNSQNSNLKWIEPFNADRLQMSLRDGEELGISQGDRVRVSSPEGAMDIEVNLSDDIIRGAVSLLQGSWTVMDESGVEKGGAANMLTSTTPTMPSQGARTHSVFVRIGKYNAN